MDLVDLYTADDIVELVRILVSHTYIHNGSIIKRQVKGLPMGTNPAPHMADLTCYRPEAQAMDRIMQTDIALARRFATTCRYIDDILSPDNAAFIQHVILSHQDHPNLGIEPIYPAFLVLKQTNDHPTQAEYLGMNIYSGVRSFIFKVSRAHTKLPEPKINYPALQGNFPTIQGYGVLTGQLHRFARICTRAIDFAQECATIHDTLLTKGFTRTRMFKCIKAFLTHHNPYKTPCGPLFSMIKALTARS